ncbi:MAG: hypothetical protein K2G60_03030 [Oscillospiraceae bacterium]|nr:hypothetical protein [Oscillospiraceae bacterium]
MKNKYITKIAAVALTLALILISVIPSFAAKAVKVKVEIAGSDGLVYVRLTAPASSNISTISAPLSYDTTKLEFKEMSFLTDDSIINSVNSETAGVVIANTVIAESLTDESKIFTYIFKVLDGAEGKCEFSFGSVKATDSANKEINIVFDGELTASLSSLEPLSPDKVQSSFEPTAPSESQTENNKENQDKPSIPNTTRKVAAISAASVVAAVAIVASAVAIKKKKENE